MIVSAKKSKAWKRTAVLLAVVLALTAVCAVYLGDYYTPEPRAADLAAAAQVTRDGDLVFPSEGADAGFIFYPGGKVDHRAYVPLMQELSDRGILCVLVEMPFRLAVLDMNAAEGIQAQYPQIEHWYIGGHSLGGAMAASYLAGHTDDFAGLVLLGAYSTEDLSQAGLSVLSVYGSEDLVMNREKYDQYLKNLPAGFQEIVIDGGCHAYFGMYGPQDGDGTPTLTNEEQIRITADAIAAMICKQSGE